MLIPPLALKIRGVHAQLSLDIFKLFKMCVWVYLSSIPYIISHTILFLQLLRRGDISAEMFSPPVPLAWSSECGHKMFHYLVVICDYQFGSSRVFITSVIPCFARYILS